MLQWLLELEQEQQELLAQELVNFDYSLILQVQCKLMQIGLVFSWVCFLLFMII
jgi:hypothetical protein